MRIWNLSGELIMIVVPNGRVPDFIVNNNSNNKSKSNSRVGLGSDPVVLRKTTTLSMPVLIPAPASAPANDSGFMGSKNKVSGRRPTPVKIPKITVVLEVKASTPTPRPRTPVHLPMIHTVESSIDRYLPPAIGTLNMRVYDAVALKNNYKIMTAVERENILQMGKESGERT